MPYWELDWTAEVTRALDLDVTGGEQDCDLTVWRRMINMRVVNVVQPDVCWIGAICRTLRVAEMAGAAGLPVTPLSENLPLVFLFMLHLMGALPNAGPYDGYYRGRRYLRSCVGRHGRHGVDY